MDRVSYLEMEVRGSSAEVGYLAVRDGRIHPLEVKSGTGGQLRSLNRMVADDPGCGDGWVLSSRHRHHKQRGGAGFGHRLSL